MEWFLTYDDDDEAHVIPLEDFIEHKLDECCTCQPKLNIQGYWVHNSIDNREEFEHVLDLTLIH